MDQKANFPGSPRYEAVAFGLGSLGYIGTGFDGSNALKDFYSTILHPIHGLI